MLLQGYSYVTEGTKEQPYHSLEYTGNYDGYIALNLKTKILLIDQLSRRRQCSRRYPHLQVIATPFIGMSRSINQHLKSTKEGSVKLDRSCRRSRYYPIVGEVCQTPPPSPAPSALRPTKKFPSKTHQIPSLQPRTSPLLTPYTSK